MCWKCFIAIMFIFIFQFLTSIVEAGEGEDITWKVADSAGLSSVARRLQTEQPQTLQVDISSTVPTPPALQQFCQVVQKKFTGCLVLNLWRSHLNYEKCDESIMVLPDFR